MKQLNRLLSALLALTVLIQCGPVSFAEGGNGTLTQEIDGVVYTQNTDGTVTAVFRAREPIVCTARHSAPRSLSTAARHLAPATRRGAELHNPPIEETDGELVAEETATEATPTEEVPSEEAQTEQRSTENLVTEEPEDTSATESIVTEESVPTESQPSGDEPAQNETEDGEEATTLDDTSAAQENEGSSSAIPDEESAGETGQTESENDVEAEFAEAEENAIADPLPEKKAEETEEPVSEDEEHIDSVTLFAAVVPESLAGLGNHAIIHDFYLHTYVNEVEGGSIFTAHRIEAVWSPGSVTFDALPAFSGQPVQTKNVSSPGWIDWDLTSLASAWFGGSSCGVLIRGEAGIGNLDLYSAHASCPAYFAVTYTPLPDSADEELNLQLRPCRKSGDSEFGYMELNWTSVPWAESYIVAVFNGQEYEFFPAGNGTFWSTENKGIWPAEEEIAAGRFRLHHDGAGAELPVGSTVEGERGNTYTFKLIPTNLYGQMPDPAAFAAQSACFETVTDHPEETSGNAKEQAADAVEKKAEERKETVQTAAALRGSASRGDIPDSCAAGDHIYTLIESIAPTCTKAGYDEYVCASCGNVKRDDKAAPGAQL